MADLADMIQKLAYYRAGGTDPGQSTYDKIGTSFGIVDKAIKDVLAIKKQNLEGQKTAAETDKLNRGNAPMSQYMKPVSVPTEGPVDAGGNPPAPAAMMMLNKSALTPDQQETVASTDLKNAQTDYYRSGQKAGKKLYINLDTLKVSEVPLPGYVETTPSSAVSAGAFPARNAPLERERELRRTERYGKYGADLISKFNSDPNVRKYKQSIDEATLIRDLAVSDNPIGAASIPTFSARMSREVGNLSEADKAPFGGSQAIDARLAASLQQMADGTLTEENKAFIIDLTQIMERNAKAALDREASLRSRQNAGTGLYGNEQQIRDSLTPPTTPSSAPTNFDPGTGKFADSEKQKRYEAFKAAHP